MERLNGFQVPAGERMGGHAPAGAASGMVQSDGRLYTADYGFVLFKEGAGQQQDSVYQRPFVWNERNLLGASLDSRYQVNYR
ncbi:MAG: hypothetical protein LBK13_11000 [Spirochaetales bacterium]|nr:hypothetical protein [Spirochaetales bacterium]